MPCSCQPAIVVLDSPSAKLEYGLPDSSMPGGMPQSARLPSGIANRRAEPRVGVYANQVVAAVNAANVAVDIPQHT
jgi:hypothetical protein